MFYNDFYEIAAVSAATTFILPVNVVDTDFKYISEQYLIGQEQHIIKTREAANFLKENWDLSILIVRAEIKLKNYFGFTSLYLELVEKEKLLLSIATQLSPEKAEEKLHQFDDEWWIDNEPLAKDRLCIDVMPI